MAWHRGKDCFLRRLDLPRIGQRFSLAPGPFPRPQTRWRESLPWDSDGNLIPHRIETMKIALGCDADTPEAREAFEWFWKEIGADHLLVRVMPLSGRRCIPPGGTLSERQARMKRWLPSEWRYEATEGRLVLLKTKRFASLIQNSEIPPCYIPLWIGPVCHREVLTCLREDIALARWLDNGEVWVFCIRPAMTTGRSAPAKFGSPKPMDRFGFRRRIAPSL